MNSKNMLDLFSKNKKKHSRAGEIGRFAAGVGIAAIAGIITGILIACKSGKETQADIKNKAISTAETVENFVQEKSNKIKTAVADTARKVSDTIENADDKATIIAKEIEDGYEKIKEDVDKIKKDISRKTD